MGALIRVWLGISAAAILALMSCQPSGRATGPATGAAPVAQPIGAPPAPAAGSPAEPGHSAEVQRLLTAAREQGETELELSWSPTAIAFLTSGSKYEALFNQLYGTNVKINFTPDPASMTAMAGKVAQQVAAGRRASTDIYLGIDGQFVGLMGQDALEEYDYTLLSPRISRGIVVPRDIGVQIYSTTPGILYNAIAVSPSDVPRKLEDSLHPRWKGRIASGIDAAYFEQVAMRPEWGGEKMKAFAVKLAENVGGLINLGEMPRLVSGEFDLMVMGSTHQMRVARAAGAPLAYVIPDDGAIVGFGLMGVPRTSGHPNLAKLFIHMMLTPEGQRLLYETYYTDHFALPGSQSGGELAELKSRGIQPLEVNVQFRIEHPEMQRLADEFAAIMRQTR
jgi:hypothetical protein